MGSLAPPSFLKVSLPGAPDPTTQKHEEAKTRSVPTQDGTVQSILASGVSDSEVESSTVRSHIIS